MSLLADAVAAITQPDSLLHKLVRLLKDPSWIVESYGYWALGIIIFLETGALIALLPGDSLLVVAGIFAAKGTLNIVTIIALLVPLAILGDACSYSIGRKFGDTFFQNPNSKLFNPKHIERARGFYETHGGKAIVMARFVPIMRTLVPVVAGFGGMTYRDFAVYNVVGGAAWIISMSLLGYFLGSAFPWVPKHIDKIVIVIVLLSVLPIVLEYLKTRRSKDVAAA
jgi:membrane-associated protein